MRGVTLALALLLAGCAVFERDNRRALVALDEHLTPANTAARWALAPLAAPVAFAAVALDMVVIQPICSVDDAWADTKDWLWTSQCESRFRRAVMLPLAVAATPPVFVSDWLARAVFPIDAREGFCE